jgi:hypothetical protein
VELIIIVCGLLICYSISASKFQFTLQNPITDTWKKSVGPFCSLESLITDYTPLKPTKFKPKKKFCVLAGLVSLVMLLKNC